MRKSLFLVPLVALLMCGCNLTTPKKSSKKSSGAITTQTTSPTTSSSGTTSGKPSSDVYPTEISLPESKTLSISEEAVLELTYYPENTTVKHVTCSSSDDSVCICVSGVDGIHITARGEGNAIISAEAEGANGTTLSASCQVTVNFGKTKLQYTYDDYISNHYYDFDNCPLEGSPKLLIIPVWFNDSSTFITNKDNVRNDIEATYLGSNEQTGWRSVRTFYEEESHGKLTLDGVVTDWFNYDESYKTVGNTNYGQSYTVDILSKGVDWFFENNPSYSKSDFDTNHDGYLDGVLIIYAAPEYDSLNNESYQNLWAYCSWLMQGKGTLSDPNPNVFFWASYDFIYGSNALSRTGKSNYSRGDTSNCSLDAHCFTHEMGHVLGLQDYYDYSSYGYSPAGGFTMQDHNVGGHDPYSVMAYGWADPYIPTSSMSITIGDFQKTHDIILLANHTVNSPFDEYILIDLYTPTGLNEFDSHNQYRGNYPQGPNEVGLRVWHIDARLTYPSGGGWSSNFTTNPNKGSVYHAMSNTHGGMSINGTPMGSAYYDYNLVQLIRNNESESVTPSTTFAASHLFKQSSTFSLSKFNSQFVKNNLMNDGKVLGWSFSVTSISNNQATINLVKE